MVLCMYKHVLSGRLDLLTQYQSLREPVYQVYRVKTTCPML